MIYVPGDQLRSAALLPQEADEPLGRLEQGRGGSAWKGSKAVFTGVGVGERCIRYILGDGFGHFDFQPLLGDDWTL